jgi:hypothetical protein
VPNTALSEPLPDLMFPLPDILGVDPRRKINILDWAGTHTAITLRVRVADGSGETFFVKTVRGDGPKVGGSKLGLREVRFYQFMEGFDAELKRRLPQCIRYHLAADEESYYLVLEDLSDAYLPHSAVDFSDLAPWRCALRSVADFHRGFTGRLSADQIADLAEDEAGIAAYIETLTAAYQQFKRDNRDHVGGEVLGLMAQSIPMIHHIELEKRSRIRQNKLTTVLNRDGHLRNFLYPKTPDRLAKIVDWQFWGVGIGAYDLRHLLGSALNPALRGHQESLVRDYYQAYVAGGGIDYPWEVCWEDYRKGVLDNLFMPVWQYAGFGWGVDRWGETLKAAVENYWALACDRLGQ